MLVTAVRAEIKCRGPWNVVPTHSRSSPSRTRCLSWRTAFHTNHVEGRVKRPHCFLPLACDDSDDDEEDEEDEAEEVELFGGGEGRSERSHHRSKYAQRRKRAAWASRRAQGKAERLRAAELARAQSDKRARAQSDVRKRKDARKWVGRLIKNVVSGVFSSITSRAPESGLVGTAMIEATVCGRPAAARKYDQPCKRRRRVTSGRAQRQVAIKRAAQQARCGHVGRAVIAVSEGTLRGRSASSRIYDQLCKTQRRVVRAKQERDMTEAMQAIQLVRQKIEVVAGVRTHGVARHFVKSCVVEATARVRRAAIQLERQKRQKVAVVAGVLTHGVARRFVKSVVEEATARVRRAGRGSYPLYLFLKHNPRLTFSHHNPGFTLQWAPAPATLF